MNSVPLTPELLAAAPGFARRLGVILAGLGALIARAFLKDPRHVGIILTLCKRLNRGAQRVTRAMANLGTITKPRALRPGRASGTPPAKLPTRNAWLLIALRHEGAYFRLQIEQLLDQPEAAGILAASPQAARILRPICRMLGLRHASLPALRRKPKPRSPDGAQRNPGRPAAAQPRPEPPSIPRYERLEYHRPIQPLCERIATRWPFVPHPNAKKPT